PALAPVGPALALVGAGLALVGDGLALIGQPLTLVEGQPRLIVFFSVGHTPSMHPAQSKGARSCLAGAPARPSPCSADPEWARSEPKPRSGLRGRDRLPRIGDSGEAD